MKTVYVLLVSLAIVSCKQANSDVQVAKKESIDSMKVVLEKQKIIDSMNQEIARAEKEKEVVVINQTSGTNSATTTTTTKKKGWSNTAKGAVIGAGVGAATGAIVSKKKGEGAIIGGLVGAAVGTGTGAVIDDNQKKKK